MSKLANTKAAQKGGTPRRRRSVAIKHVRGPKGQETELFVVDSNDDNFDDDLTYVFQRNVARARQENKRLFGSPDGVPSMHSKGKNLSGLLNGARKK